MTTAEYSLMNPPPTMFGPGGYVIGTPYNTQLGRATAEKGEGAVIPDLGGDIYRLQAVIPASTLELSWVCIGVTHPYTSEPQNVAQVKNANARIGVIVT